jgi:DNA-directed RNA polymerase specialized sigma24 family protein
MSESPSHLFPTTHWTLVDLLNSPDVVQAEIALDRICRAYYRPLYVCARVSGLSAHDSEDAVQDFMAHIIANDGLKTLQREKGRVRGWMKRSFINHLHHLQQKRSALRRGGDCAHLSFDFDVAEQLFQHQHAGELSADHACDLRTALDLWQETLLFLDRDIKLQRRPLIYQELRPHILTGWTSHNATQEEAAQKLGISAAALRVRLHHLAQKAKDTFVRLAQENLDPLITPEEVNHLWQMLRIL